MHWNICKHYNLPVTENCYDHKPNTVTENDECIILWDMPIHIDREIKANRPDIIVEDKEQKQCYDQHDCTNKAKCLCKRNRKLSKYKDLEIETIRMWGMKTLTIPGVFGALGLIKKGLDRYINKIPGKIDIRKMRKSASWIITHPKKNIVSQVNIL